MKLIKTFTGILFVMGMLLSCSILPRIPKPSVLEPAGEILTKHIDEAPSSADEVDVRIYMGGGTMKLAGGTEKFVEGTIKYNVEELAPEVKRGLASINIEQTISWDELKLFKDYTNDWDLRFGPTPSNFDISIGGYKGTFDFGDLAVKNLKIQEGASNSEFTFSKPNLTEMGMLDFRTGASSVKMSKLGNAKFGTMEFSGGAGSYELDFSGTLARDANVTINAGVSQIKLYIPESTNAKIIVEEGVTNITASDDWSIDNKVYTNQQDGPLLLINVNMGLGSLELIKVRD